MLINNLTTCTACQCDANNACTVTERHNTSVKEAFSKGDGILIFWSNTESSSRYITSMEMQDLNTNLVCHVTEWLCTVSQLPRNGTYYIHFETILKHAERLGYEIQDILCKNDAERLGYEIQDILSKNDLIYFVNTSIYLSMWYHNQLHRNWNQCNFMDHKNLCQMILLKMSLCITSMLCGLATAVAVLKIMEQIIVLQDTCVLHRKRYVVQVLLLSWNSYRK